MSRNHIEQKSKSDRKISKIMKRYYSLDFDIFIQEFKVKNSIFSKQISLSLQNGDNTQ